jgi:ABC-type lipoprotein export system ATPase subunit
LNTIKSFRSRRSSISKQSASASSKPLTEERPFTLAREWGIDPALWDREWATLSGGEGQRIALAIAAGLTGAEVILLDGECDQKPCTQIPPPTSRSHRAEPTSALDEETMKKVEKSMVAMLRDHSVSEILSVLSCQSRPERL